MGLEGLRVLVVEDEAMIASLLEDLLAEFGCKMVGLAKRLDEAMEKADQLTFDIALLDLNLAGRMSYPVAEVLRRRGVPFVFASGYGRAGLPDNLRDAPMLAKPFHPAQLAAAMLAARQEAEKPPP